MLGTHVPSTNANMLVSVNTHAPRQTIAMVRMPAGLSARRRSNPMIDPMMIDITIRRVISASHFVIHLGAAEQSHNLLSTQVARLL